MEPLISKPWLPLAVFVLLAGAYSMLVPAFEAPDESAHFAYVNHLLEHRRLPAFEVTNESHQPPPYYLFLALVASPFRPHGLDAPATPNPNFQWTGPAKNLFLHPHGGWLDFEGDYSLFHKIRLLQLFLGAITVLFVWKLARLVLPEEPEAAWLAAMLAATVPQFLFISASISNDNLVNALSAVTLFLMFKACAPRLPSTGQAFGLGLLMGACLLAKGTALFLLPVWVFACSLGPEKPAGKIARAAIGVAGAVAAAGWFYVWNAFRYGNLTGTPMAIDWHSFPRLFRFGYWYYLFRSFWGRFGWLNVKAPLAAYVVFIVLSALIAAGWVLLLWKASSRRGAAERRGAGGLARVYPGPAPASPVRARALRLATAATLLLLASVPLFTIRHDPFFQPQGRYLFAALAPLGLLMALGCTSALPGARLRLLRVWGIPLVMVVVNTAVLAFSIYPAYYR